MSLPAIFIGVGSNLDPERNLFLGLRELRGFVRVLATSTFYRTPSVGGWAGQPDFLNGVWRVETELPPRDLKFGVLREVERRTGRVRGVDRCAPRTLDLDIVIYGDMVESEGGVRLPDPDVRTRPFLAVPLLELAPDLVLPDTGERLSRLASAVPSASMDPQPVLTEALRRAILEPLPARAGTSAKAAKRRRTGASR